MTCNDKCIHYPVCEQKNWDFANIDECKYYAETFERPQGVWIRKENPRYAYDREHGDLMAGVSYHCSKCDGIGDDSDVFCKHCGTKMEVNDETD